MGQPLRMQRVLQQMQPLNVWRQQAVATVATAVAMPVAAFAVAAGAELRALLLPQSPPGYCLLWQQRQLLH